MKHLRIRELDLVSGGQGEDFRTIQIHQVPRLDSPAIDLTNEARHSGRSWGDRPLRPIPMHWLPPRSSGPQEY